MSAEWTIRVTAAYNGKRRRRTRPVGGPAATATATTVSGEIIKRVR